MNKRRPKILTSFLYSRSESNRDRQNRNLKFYPLNYGSIHPLAFSPEMDNKGTNNKIIRQKYAMS